MQVQERELQSSRMEVDELQQLLQSNEDMLAEFQRNLSQKEQKLEELRSKGILAIKVRGTNLRGTNTFVYPVFLCSSSGVPS